MREGEENTVRFLCCEVLDCLINTSALKQEASSIKRRFYVLQKIGWICYKMVSVCELFSLLEFICKPVKPFIKLTIRRCVTAQASKVLKVFGQGMVGNTKRRSES